MAPTFPTRRSSGRVPDVLLTRGAKRVYAVDVGHGQLAWKLRGDPRVIVLERTNARHLSAELVPEPIDIAVCDASFISLAKVLDIPLGFVRPGGASARACQTTVRGGPG